MSNVISLQAVRELRELKNLDDIAYKAKILAMDKFELLEEMIKFQQQRSTIGHLTVEMMIRGKILFKELEEHAETKELTLLARSYRRHLEYELSSRSKVES
ncbi:MAG: hypothetical protein AABZ06_03020 [Bdellovibrionota bacterium]